MYYRSKRRKTAEYLAFQNEVRDEMEGVKWPFGKDEVVFTVRAGLSNRGADLDNINKPLFDTFQNTFEEFNDNKVYEIHLFKDIVQKGEEYIDVKVQARAVPKV